MIGNVEFSLTEEGKKYYDRFCTNDNNNNCNLDGTIVFDSTNNNEIHKIWRFEGKT